MHDKTRKACSLGLLPSGKGLFCVLVTESEERNVKAVSYCAFSGKLVDVWRVIQELEFSFKITKTSEKNKRGVGF